MFLNREKLGNFDKKKFTCVRHVRSGGCLERKMAFWSKDAVCFLVDVEHGGGFDDNQNEVTRRSRGSSPPFIPPSHPSCTGTVACVLRTAVMSHRCFLDLIKVRHDDMAMVLS